MAAYLRSHVTPGADASRHLKILRLGHDPADSEVRDLQLPVLCQEQIHGLEVPVDHLPVVKKAECAGDGHAPVQDLPQLWAPAPLPPLCLLSVVALKVTTGHEFGDAHDRQARLEASANEHDQVWVPHGRQEVDLMHQLIRDLENAGILFVGHAVLAIHVRIGVDADFAKSGTFYHHVRALPFRHVEAAFQGLAQLLLESKVPAGEHPMTVTATARQLPAAQLASFFRAVDRAIRPHWVPKVNLSIHRLRARR
mmetsp:Transcript_37128/g.85809  ORF Transcript_37128/g.85809 Transcript_37128/m.85809 type:complete len:253 (+) Transcript_37128:523-1281(+)